DADVKIYLTASAEKRAMRRLLEHQAKGVDISFDEVLADINERDHRDMTREISPLCKAEDAVELDNGDLDLEGTVKAALTIIEGKMK
ncbi:MAG: cytidylate kinase, partial [Ruminococcaceae bacterium]|nr:cytidylate kinase [Oscillospiraceae bacterium]